MKIKKIITLAMIGLALIVGSETCAKGSAAATHVYGAAK